MAKQGWISLHRSIQDNWIWDEKPYDKARAWIDILLMVNHEKKRVLLGSQLIDVDKGEKITSIRKLSDRWGWSTTKTEKFLKILESDKMLVVKKDTKKTVLKVLNYAIYQDSGKEESNTEVTPKSHRSNTEVTPKNTNNNDNNANNENKGVKPNSFSVIIDNYTVDAELRKTILDFVEMRKKNKKNMTERALELMLKKLDNLAVDDLTKQLILNQSIENCWQGIFELKGGTTNKKTPITSNPFLEMAMNGDFDDE